MAIEVTMPQMGESIVEGTITKWLVKEGDTVVEDQPLVEISTDKVDTEIPSPGAGRIAKIVAEEGQTLPVGAKLAVIEQAAQESGAKLKMVPPKAVPKPMEPQAEKPASRADASVSATSSAFAENRSAQRAPAAARESVPRARHRNGWTNQQARSPALSRIDAPGRWRDFPIEPAREWCCASNSGAICFSSHAGLVANPRGR